MGLFDFKKREKERTLDDVLMGLSSDVARATLIYKIIKSRTHVISWQDKVPSGYIDYAIRVFKDTGHHNTAVYLYAKRGDLKSAIRTTIEENLNGIERFIKTPELCEFAVEMYIGKEDFETALHLVGREGDGDAKKILKSTVYKAKSMHHEAREEWREAAKSAEKIKEFSRASILYEKAEMIDHAAASAQRAGDSKRALELFENSQEEHRGKGWEFHKQYLAALIEESRTNEAIDYLRSYGNMGEAFDIAQEHCPERLEEISRQALVCYPPHLDDRSIRFLTYLKDYETLESAFLGDGRFDIKLISKYLSREECWEVMEIHLRKLDFSTGLIGNHMNRLKIVAEGNLDFVLEKMVDFYEGHEQHELLAKFYSGRGDNPVKALGYAELAEFNTQRLYFLAARADDAKKAELYKQQVYKEFEEKGEYMDARNFASRAGDSESLARYEELANLLKKDEPLLPTDGSLMGTGALSLADEEVGGEVSYPTNLEGALSEVEE